MSRAHLTWTPKQCMRLPLLKTPRNLPQQTDNRRFFDWLGEQLGYKHMDDWYRVTLKDIYKHGGKGILYRCYNGSPSKALQTVYPEHNWTLWRFGRTPKGFWEKSENRRNFFDWLAHHLGFKEM